MKTTAIKKYGTIIAVVESEMPIITDGQSALDILANVRYETDCTCVALYKTAFCDAFFELRTGVLGEVLQKFINYRTPLAIIGDHAVYTSKALRDFIYESNQGSAIHFAETLDDALMWCARK